MTVATIGAPLSILVAAILTSASLQAVTPEEPRIVRSIIYDQKDIFEEGDTDWFFAAPLLNALHTITRPYLIDDELLVLEGDDADSIRLLETERNLRRTGLFSSVKVSVVNVGEDSVDIIIATQEAWSLKPALLLGTGGGISNVGFKLEETNLAGTATQVMGYGLYRTENDIGWEGMLQLYQRRLFRTEVGLNAALRANQYRTDQVLAFTKPYRTMSTPWAFSVNGRNAYGRDFAYRIDTTVLLPFHDRSGEFWISQSYGEDDRLFVSGALSVNNVQRAIQASRQAFDNTGHILVSFSSLRQDFSRSVFLNGYETEDIQTGAWGSATLGRVFSLGNGGETMWYISGLAEQSVLPSNDLYLFGQVGAGSGFGAGRARYTYLEVRGLGHWRASEHFVVAARLRTQTSWNWTAYRQLVLDFESGLRGYQANQLAGDNRVIGNAELRWFPGWRWWVVGFSGAIFYDVGSVWDQGVSILNSRYHHAVGFGIRFHNLKASGSDAIFRFDFAFNLDEKKFAGLIFTTDQLFSAFFNHRYRSPDLSGTSIDVQ